jgi:probable O-glycosylation ligase (exosortase A-associated)
MPRAAKDLRRVREIFFILFLAAVFGLGFKRPFVFVLGYVYVDIVAPQRLSYLLLNTVPVSMIAVGLAMLGWAIADKKADSRVSGRHLLLAALLAWAAYTTWNADFPVEAMTKWDWVWKAIVFAMFLPLTLRTKLRIEALLVFMLLSVGSIIIVGGIKTALSGGGYGTLNLMVDNNSGLYEGSIISAVAIAIIPLILFFTRHGTIFPPDWRVKIFCYAFVFACLLMPVGTEARTGLVCIAFLAVLMLRDARRRILYIAATAFLGLLSLPFLPESFTQRMGTISEYQADSSASTRVMVWKWTWDYVKDHPAGGGFDAYRSNKIEYDTVATITDESGTRLERRHVVDEQRAYHSSYFEMLGEQGYFGFALWSLLHAIGVVRMEVIRRRYRSDTGSGAWISPLATAIQHSHLVILLGSLFVGIAFLPFIFMLIGLEIGLDTYLRRLDRMKGWAPFMAPCPAPPDALPA